MIAHYGLISTFPHSLFFHFHFIVQSNVIEQLHLYYNFPLIVVFYIVQYHTFPLLVLADALVAAVESPNAPSLVVDFATLTGMTPSSVPISRPSILQLLWIPIY